MAGKVFWLPGRVLVVFFYFGSTVFLTFFFWRLPAGCQSPCGVCASVGHVSVSVLSSLFHLTVGPD